MDQSSTTQLPPTLPRATELQDFYANPFAFLTQARANLGDIFVLRERGPLFSRNTDCSGVVAVFGPTYTQAVLTDIDAYSLPISAAEHLALPKTLINLNRGLHSMRGKQHGEHQRLLMQVFNNRTIEATDEIINASLDRFLRAWDNNRRISLLEEMRRLTLELSACLLFDERYDERDSLAALAQRYFHMRRDATSALTASKETTRTELVALGTSLDDAMREYITWCRNQQGSLDGLLSKVACLQANSDYAFGEDEVVAHGNVMLMSTNEPIAVALAWTLLVLSQIPGLRRELRGQLQQSQTETRGHSLLNSVINESLRLFTPNALMSRVTTREILLNDVSLPARCELMLCPFVAHRDPNVFKRPAEFLPSRWDSTRPSPFEYFPFGAGGHGCIGRSLGIKIIKTALAFLMRRYELVLAYDQEIDWRIDIIFMPANDPVMTLHRPRKTDVKAGTVLGPVTELFHLVEP